MGDRVCQLEFSQVHRGAAEVRNEEFPEPGSHPEHVPLYAQVGPHPLPGLWVG